MKRRDFFKSLTSMVAGVYLGCHVKPLPKTLLPVEVGNPAWESAEYEVAFLYGQDCWKAHTMGPPPEPAWNKPWPENMGETRRGVKPLRIRFTEL